jgi:hypothetical protein
MSGEKCSTVNYDRRGNLILQIGSAKDDLIKNVDSHSRRIKHVLTTTDNTKTSLQNNLLSDILEQKQKVLRDILDSLEEKGRELHGFVVQINALVNGLEEDQRQLLKEADFLKKAEENVATINAEIEKIFRIDRMVIEANQRLGEIDSILKGHENLFHEWDAEVARKGREEVNALRLACKSVIEPITAGQIDTCLTEASSALKGAGGLFGRLNGAVADCTIKDNETRALIKKAGELRGIVNECMASARVSETKTLLSEYQERLDRASVELSTRRLTGQAQALDDVAGNLPVLVEIDEDIAAIETEVAKIRSTFTDNEKVFEKWTLIVYTEQSTRLDRISNDLVRIRKALVPSKRLDPKDVKSLLADLRRLSGDVESTLADATEKNELHKKRVYVVQGLRVVCKSLGFQEIDTPHYAEKDDVYSPVVQSFDTLNVGKITFRVALKGMLESSSGITVGKCDDEFIHLAELLKEKFGIETAFKIASTGEPLKKRWTAKDLPTSAKKMSNQ